MITDVPGVQVGHWTDLHAATGCTVVLLPEGTVASAEVRGGAPAEREVALLEPSRMVQRLDALVLTGGSAFGLASADGAVRFCEEQGRGVETLAGTVPIVVALGLFDLDRGDPAVRPGPEEGYTACRAAASTPPGPVELGRVGAGTGTTVNRVGRLTGRGEPRPGGLVSATLTAGDLVVSALVVVNAFGDPVGAGWSEGRSAEDAGATAAALIGLTGPAPVGSTTVGLVATNASLSKVDCFLVAQAAHHGLARVVQPSHTRFDGDAFVAASVGAATKAGPGEVGVDVVRLLATEAVAAAVRTLPGSHGDGA